MATQLAEQFQAQRFPNGYELVDGVKMHAQNGEQFQVPPDVLKKHIQNGHFVELRIDSPRFSVHEEAAEKCFCPSCHGEATKPILRHEEPVSLVPIPPQQIPSRGWGEDFWVEITAREGDFFEALIDNSLYETPLHELRQGDMILFHVDHVLAVHASHRQQIVAGMDVIDLRVMAEWLGQQ
jgi:hypothetical protein